MSRGTKVKRRWSQTDILFLGSDKCPYSGGSTPQEGSLDLDRQHSDTTRVNTPHCHSIHKSKNAPACFDRGKNNTFPHNA